MSAPSPDPTQTDVRETLDAGVELGGSRFRELGAQLIRRPSSITAICFLVVLIILAFLAPIVEPNSPTAQALGDAFAGPSGRHLLGTDYLGRDVLSRMIDAVHVELLAPVIAVGVAVVLGVPSGLWAGLRGGYVDAILSRLADTLLSLPGLAFALAIVAVLGPGLTNAMFALGIFFAPTLYRVVRGASMAVSREMFIASARSVGCSTKRSLWVHILPNVAAPLLVQATILMGVALVAEAGMSFLGLGIQPPQASWGTMLRDAYNNQFQAPYSVLPPGIAVVLTVLAFNTLGDTLRDAMTARWER